MHTKEPLDAARDSADLHARAAINFSAFTPEEVARMAHYDCRETQCVDALTGIADPAAFMAAVRELVAGQRRWREERQPYATLQAADKIIALLPPETP